MRKFIAAVAVAAASTVSAQTVPVSLSASLAALNVLDVHSTSVALNRGAQEINPAMRLLGGGPLALGAMKGAVTGITIWSANRMWKQGRRKTSIAVLVVSNVMMAAIVRHNYNQPRGLN